MSSNLVKTLQKQQHLSYKDECIVDHMTVKGWFKKFCLSRKNLDKPKTIDSKAVLQAREANPAKYA